MGKGNAAVKQWMSNRARFADLFNGIFFQGEQIINAPLPAEPSAINGADGSFEFDQITFDETGIYCYTIVGKNNGIPGITYDKAVYTVKVEIRDEGFDGQLDAAVTIADAPVVFENKYEAAPAKVQISEVKVLNGRALEAGEFEFDIEAVTDNLEGRLVEEFAEGFEGIKFVNTYTEPEKP